MAAKKNSSKKSRQARRRRVDLILQPTITTELQILYNIWRDLEEKGKAAKKGQRDRKTENAARLAFKRRLGACAHCKKRKTNCTHWALDKLEDAYQLKDTRDSKETSDEIEDEVSFEKGEAHVCECERKKGGESPLLDSPSSPLPSPPASPKMEGSQPTTPTTPRVKTEEEKLEVTIEDQPITIKMEDSFEKEDSKAPTNDMALGAPFEYALSSDQYPYVPMPAAFDKPCAFQIGIGRLITPYNPQWECVFAAGEPPKFCSEIFHNEQDLVRHFSSTHHPIKPEAHFFICRLCQMWNDMNNYCLQCGWMDAGMMEYWLVGYPEEENIENLSGSSSTLTEGREGKTEDGASDGSGGHTAVVTEAQAMSDMFTRPQGISEEEFRRRVMAVEANSEMFSGSGDLFSIPRQAGPEPCFDFASPDLSASAAGNWWLRESGMDNGR